jgi:hypothetical protein
MAAAENALAVKHKLIVTMQPLAWTETATSTPIAL